MFHPKQDHCRCSYFLSSSRTQRWEQGSVSSENIGLCVSITFFAFHWPPVVNLYNTPITQQLSSFHILPQHNNSQIKWGTSVCKCGHLWHEWPWWSHCPQKYKDIRNNAGLWQYKLLHWQEWPSIPVWKGFIWGAAKNGERERTIVYFI